MAMITLVIAVWPSVQGLDSPFFVFYYPIVLAFAFVMPPRLSIVFTAMIIAAYVSVSFLIGGEDGLTLAHMEVDSLKTLVVRLITIGAMGGLGTYYWRVQRNLRRQSARPAGS